MKHYIKLLLLGLLLLCGSPVATAQTPQQFVEMPDPNLKQAVREALDLPDEIPLTQGDMPRLTRLNAQRKQIKDLTGLEHATALKWLNLGRNEIRDLHPLARLVRLESLFLFANPISDFSPLANLTELRKLDFGGCQISDIAPLADLMRLVSLRLHHNQIEDICPLANLTQLTELRLNGNRIVDVSPLANLTRLVSLHLHRNQIVDVSPLANLIMLEKLWIEDNVITDHGPLKALSLTHFVYDECCELPRLPIQDRIQGRSFPSVFTAWGGIGWSPVLNLPELSDIEHLAHHDLYWSPRFGLHWFGLHFQETRQGIKVRGNLEAAQQERDAFLALNPNMIFLVEIRMRDTRLSNFPEDSPYWIRDAQGNVAAGGGKRGLMDFTHPDIQDMIVQQAIAVAKCGLHDGIFFDWWTEDGPVLADSRVGWSEGYRGTDAEQRARDAILQRIRAGVRNDFLIMVNTNRRKIPRSAPYVNGTFMETLRDYDGGYTHDGLLEIESTLLWAEENLREPQINGLEGWGVATESPASPTNLRWMRATTTLSLTHSDGYVLFNDGGAHKHYWYDFWDADLGTPGGAKAQLYENRPGLFIREFTHGWAVYNRSGQTQEIVLPLEAVGVASGRKDTTHHLPDLDGEIYLRRNLLEFNLSIPGGTSLIHVPLKVTAVDGDAKPIESVGDLYDALGGAATVNLLITRDPETQRWNGYLGKPSRDGPADKALTDDLGIIAGMKAPVSVRLGGDALGIDGSSSITLHPGTNLVGVPLKDSRIARVSNLLALEGIGGNVPSIIVSDNGAFQVVARAGDDGDIPIIGGQSFVLNAQGAATVALSGDGWYNISAMAAAPPMAITGIEVGEATPVLALTGSIVDDGTGLNKAGFRVIVKNLSTGRAVTTVTGDEHRPPPDKGESKGVGYQLTVVDTETGRAAQIGDILEISAQSPMPFVGVQPFRYTVTAEDVRRSRIKLAELIAYEIPSETELLLNYPNPFNPETWIPYRLAADAFVTLTIYDMTGGVVRNLEIGHKPAAVYESKAKAIYWDGRNGFGERVASGVYFYHLSAGNYSATQKMVILK